MNRILKVFGRKKNPYYNHEGYPDPTAYYGIKSAMKREEDVELHDLVNDIRDMVDMTDFEIVGRIVFRNKKSGRVFK